MGHEYLEMKNSTAAINSYRNAVEIDPKDFRAWYGLGQTYELQNMNQYALYYFSRAVISRLFCMHNIDPWMLVCGMQWVIVIRGSKN